MNPGETAPQNPIETAIASWKKEAAARQEQIDATLHLGQAEVMLLERMKTGNTQLIGEAYTAKQEALWRKAQADVEVMRVYLRKTQGVIRQNEDALEKHRRGQSGLVTPAGGQFQ